MAVCCLYSLFPPQFRVAAVEKWLGLEAQPIATPVTPATSANPVNPASTGDHINPDYQAPAANFGRSEPESKQKVIHPKLDFNKIAARIARLPDREELRANLLAKVIGQDAAIDQLIRVVLGQLASQNKAKPLVVFLPGPTGTGKTELSKALASALGVELIRFDMGEFGESHKASNLFGSAKGYVGSEDGGALPQALRKSKKLCVILFDEVEKAHQSLWRQMLAFFDEGRVSDTIGSVQAPKDTICLLTSNLKAEKIADNPGKSKDILKESGYFPPEFLGRINKIIPLLRLNEADSGRLIVTLTKQLADSYGISLIIDQDSLQMLFNEVYEEAQKYGGRGIKDKVSDLLMDDFIDLQGRSHHSSKITS